MTARTRAKATKKTGRKTGRRTTKKKATKKRAKIKSTPRKPASRKPGTFKKGSDARRGSGKKGRSGRIPNEVKAAAADAVFSFVLPKLINYVKAPKKTASDPGWRWAAATLLERGFGKVPQPITGDDEGDPIGVRVDREAALRERLLGDLARIAGRTGAD